MINLIISLLIGAASWGLSLLIFDSPMSGIIPFIICTLLSMVILNRITSRKVNAIINEGMQMMQNIQSLPSEQARINLCDKCIDTLKKGYAYKNYVFFLKQQLNAQIGSIYYATNRHKEAEPYLANAFVRQAEAVCMYACLLYQKKDYDGMTAQFEKALKFSPKKPMLWNIYAWCLLKSKKRDEAISVLNRCLTANPADKPTMDNLDLLKNSGAMKMRDYYHEQWYQFMLEKPNAMELQKMLLDKHSVVRSR